MDRPVLFLRKKPKCTLHRQKDVLLFNGFKLKYCRTAQDCAVNIKIGVFCCGSNQCNGTVFDKFQQCLLLFFIKILDLIQIQKNAVRRFKRAEPTDNLVDIRRGSRSSVHLIKSSFCPVGNEGRQRGLPHAGGPVKDHIGNIARLNNFSERFPRI